MYIQKYIKSNNTSSKKKLNIHTKRFVTKILFGLLSLTFTYVIFVNSYEIIANKDVALGFALSKMTIQDPINRAIEEFNTKYNVKNLGSNAKLGSLDTLVIEDMKIQVLLEEARKIDGYWYQRPSIAQYIELNKDIYGNPVDYLIYLNKSWRSIPYVEELEEGTRISIVTKNGHISNFIIDSRTVLTPESAFIVGQSERRQVILMVEDPENNRYYGYSLISTRD